MFPCLDPLGLLVCLSRYHSLMIGEEKPSVAISGRSSHKMTGLRVFSYFLHFIFLYLYILMLIVYIVVMSYRPDEFSNCVQIKIN